MWSRSCLLATFITVTRLTSCRLQTLSNLIVGQRLASQMADTELKWARSVNKYKLVDWSSNIRIEYFA